MTHPHIVKAFDNELKTLANGVAAMGDFAAVQFSDAIDALLTRDLGLAQRVIEQDRQLDALRRDLSAVIAAVIARRQPMATDLEEVLADFRIVEDLERVGDLAKNIAKRTTAVANEQFPQQLVLDLKRLAALAVRQLNHALNAYLERNPEQAIRIRDQDEQVDVVHTEVFAAIVARMAEDRTHVLGLVHLLFCAKNIERIGDHAAHIAEAAYLTATGERPASERPRRDLASLLKSDDDAARQG
jgi:phosphate transport system protein